MNRSTDPPFLSLESLRRPRTLTPTTPRPLSSLAPFSTTSVSPRFPSSPSPLFDSLPLPGSASLPLVVRPSLLTSLLSVPLLVPTLSFSGVRGTFGRLFNTSVVPSRVVGLTLPARAGSSRWPVVGERLV